MGLLEAEENSKARSTGTAGHQGGKEEAGRNILAKDTGLT